MVGVRLLGVQPWRTTLHIRGPAEHCFLCMCLEKVLPMIPCALLYCSRLHGLQGDGCTQEVGGREGNADS